MLVSCYRRRTLAIPARLSFATLGVTDVARATRFYQALGFPLSSGSVEGEVSFFKTAGGLLALWRITDMADDVKMSTDDRSAFSATALAMNLDSAEQVDEALTAARTNGGRIIKPGTKLAFGYHGYFADLDEHIWEVAYNRDFPIGSDGRPTLP
jgi:predicted lactoylglutathione lyase